MTNYYWTIDGVPACQSNLTWGPDVYPPFTCAGTLEMLTCMVERFNKLRPGYDVKIIEGRCPESGLGREGKWDTR